MATQARLQVVESAQWPKPHWVRPQLTGPRLTLSGLTLTNLSQNKTISKSYIEKFGQWKIILPQYFLPDLSGRENHEEMFAWWAGEVSSLGIYSGQDKGGETFLTQN